MKPRLAIAVLAAVFFLSACSLLPGQQAPDYVVDAQDIVKAADWTKMETITVEIEEHSYTPQDLVLERNRPYKLVLKNLGEKKHYFTAPAFYKAIATRKVQSNKDGEIKAPYFTALELMAEGGQLDLYFVPVKAGTYVVYCTIDDHREQGMEGSIIIR